MSEIEEDLRVTAEAIIADAERVKGIEQEKLELDADDPRVSALAKEAEDIAERLRLEVAMERELTAEAELAR